MVELQLSINYVEILRGLWIILKGERERENLVIGAQKISFKKWALLYYLMKFVEHLGTIPRIAIHKSIWEQSPVLLPACLKVEAALQEVKPRETKGL